MYDDLLVAGSSQAKIQNSCWWVHFNGGYDALEQSFVLSCLVANNGDHCKPNLVDGSLEYIVRISKPFAPVRFPIWTPGKTESFVCLVTFERMHEDAERPDITNSNDVPMIEAVEQESSIRWHWKDMPF